MKYLFIGLGNLNAQIFDVLVLRAKSGDQFLVGGRNQKYLQERCLWTASSALQLGLSVSIDVIQLDLLHVEQTAQIISSFQPDVIFSSATLISAKIFLQQISAELYAQLMEAQGVWMPVNLLLLYKLMQAVKQTGRNVLVLNGAAPDNLHTVLSKVGLAPTSGFGNTANVIPPLRQAIATQIQQPVEHIRVLLFAHVYVSQMFRTGIVDCASPMHLTAYLNDEDITARLDMPAIFRILPLTLEHEYTQLLTVTTAISVLNMLTSEEPGVVHAPGPNGLPGAYPIRRGKEGMEVVLPHGLTLEDAIQVNQCGLKIGGVEKIEQDGTITFTEKHVAILKRMLGYECYRLPLSEVEDRAHELLARYAIFVDRQ